MLVPLAVDNPAELPIESFKALEVAVGVVDPEEEAVESFKALEVPEADPVPVEDPVPSTLPPPPLGVHVITILPSPPVPGVRL